MEGGGSDQPGASRSSLPRTWTGGPGPLPLLPPTSPPAGWSQPPQRGSDERCGILEDACASVPGGTIHGVPSHPSQEKHSRLIVPELLNIQKAVML